MQKKSKTNFASSYHGGRKLEEEVVDQGKQTIPLFCFWSHTFFVPYEVLSLQKMDQ